MKENRSIIILGIIVIIGVGSAMGFFYWQKYGGAKTQTLEHNDPCSGFQEVGGEISCGDARAIAVKKYPGQVLNIEKTILPYQFGTPPKLQIEDKKVWLVNIKPDNPLLIPTPPKKPGSEEMEIIETIGVAVDQGAKEILFFQSFFKK